MISSTGERFTLDPTCMICRTIVDDGASQLVRVLPDWRLNDQSVLWLVYPRSNILTPKTRVFMDFLIEHLGKRKAWRV